MPLKTLRDEEPAINMTPMIDMVFLLIIFFLVGTTFSQWEGSIDLQVPQVAETGALTAPPQQRVVNIYRDGRIVLDQQPVDLKELTRRLAAARAQYPELGVVVRGDAAGTFQGVAEVLSACRAAGISELGISVRLPNVER
jgi:biopolymer transport protein ExbD